MKRPWSCVNKVMLKSTSWNFGVLLKEGILTIYNLSVFHFLGILSCIYLFLYPNQQIYSESLRSYNFFLTVFLSVVITIDIKIMLNWPHRQPRFYAPSVTRCWKRNSPLDGGLLDHFEACQPTFDNHRIQLSQREETSICTSPVLW